MMRLSVMRALVDAVAQDGECTVVDDVAALWTDKSVHPRLFRASANFVFTFREGNRRCALRLAGTSERSRGLIQAEVDYIGHLAANGVPVARPLRSIAGREVETARTPIMALHAVVFGWLDGEQLDIDELTLDQFSRWGAALGQLHRASLGYRGSGRPDSRELLAALTSALPADEHAARGLRREVDEQMARLPIDGQNFGLLHGDFELDNLVWADDAIGIVDLDDSKWGWFAADIAFALRDLFDDRPENVDLGDVRLRAFVDGYRIVQDLRDEDLGHIPLFLQAHNLITFAKLLRTLDVPDDEPVPAWLDELRHKLVGRLGAYRDQFTAADTGRTEDTGH